MTDTTMTFSGRKPSPVRLISDPSKPSWNDPFPPTAPASEATKPRANKTEPRTRKSYSKQGSAQRREAS